MICKKCGCRVSDTATFCEKCGAPMAEFGIKEETPQKNESAAIKSGKAVVEKVKGDRKLQIILAVVVVLLVLGAVVGHITSKNKVFGISPNMSVAQVERVLGKDVPTEAANGLTLFTKENVEMGQYNGTLMVSVHDEGGINTIFWYVDYGVKMPEPDLTKMLTSKYGKNQVEVKDKTDTVAYKSETSVWTVTAGITNVTYDDVSDALEYDDVTIIWRKK